ncbi:MAG: polysaccharide biosynthesis C-terminal domain-containing protein [Saprospiraceae bacterium]|nr:polysaccharide biosynthesis C-terminal domain-containing protein [Saprospiraceae bacterium]
MPFRRIFQLFDQTLHRVLGKELDAKLRSFFLNGAYKSLFMQLALSALTLITTIIIARLAGDSGFGIYSLVFTWISVLGVAAVFGTDDLLQKILPIHKSKKNFPKLKGGWIWANQLVLLGGGALTLVFALVVNFGQVKGLSNYAFYYNLALPVVICFALMHTNQAALRAMGNFGIGQLAEKIIQPLAFIVVLGLWYFLATVVLDVDVILARTISFVVAVVAALGLVVYHLWLKYKTIQAEYEYKTWTKSCLYFAAISTLYFLNTRLDILFLGFFEINPKEIAYYNVALKFTDLILIPFLVVCTVTMPMFAELYANAAQQKLQHLYTRVTQLVTVVVGLGALVLAIFGEFFLNWYGTTFQEGYQVLLILTVVKIIHVVVGPANLLLMMIGFEKAVAAVLALSVIVTALLHYTFIPIWGTAGAAWASLIGLCVFELGVSWVAWRKARIWTSVLGRSLSLLSKKN